MKNTSRSRRGGKPEDQRERAEATRATIVQVARKLFAENGFHATGTTEITARAGMTRGALYHHFADKAELFSEVFREVAGELILRSNSAVTEMSGDLWPQVREAYRQYLYLVAAHEEYRRILLIDGPAVLGWARWRELQSEFVARGTADALQLLMAKGLVDEQPTMPLACIIQSALHDAALTIAHETTLSPRAEQAVSAFFYVLEGLRRPLPERG